MALGVEHLDGDIVVGAQEGLDVVGSPGHCAFADAVALEEVGVEVERAFGREAEGFHPHALHLPPRAHEQLVVLFGAAQCDDPIDTAGRPVVALVDAGRFGPAGFEGMPFAGDDLIVLAQYAGHLLAHMGEFVLEGHAAYDHGDGGC